MVCSYLPGVVAGGSIHEFSEDVFFQAGGLLRRLHVPAGTGSSYEPAALNKIQEFLRPAEPLLEPALLERFQALVAAHEPKEAALVATHGDYQPRNWVVNDGVVRNIDFGRAGYRPWVTDVSRIHHKYFVDHPELREAFCAGYGRGMGEEDRGSWLLENYLQSVGTVVKAHDAGDAAFEVDARRMVERVLCGPV